VVAGNDGDVLVIEMQVLFEEALDRFELLLEREVGEVAGDDDVIDLRPRDLARDRANVSRPMLVLALQLQVHPAGEPLVEEATGREAVQGEDVEIGEVRDAHPFTLGGSSGDGDRHLPPNQRGEIAIRSAANIKGYWRNPEATAAAFTADGYIKTGDIGYLDDDGYLFIVDRKKDIIIRGGENISAAEVEAAIYGSEGIAEAAVFGAPDERLGEEVAATVHGDADLDLDELRTFLYAHLARHEVPRHIFTTDEPLPRTATGKLFKRQLRDESVARLAP